MEGLDYSNVYNVSRFALAETEHSSGKLTKRAVQEVVSESNVLLIGNRPNAQCENRFLILVIVLFYTTVENINHNLKKPIHLPRC